MANKPIAPYVDWTKLQNPNGVQIPLSNLQSMANKVNEANGWNTQGMPGGAPGSKTGTFNRSGSNSSGAPSGHGVVGYNAGQYQMPDDLNMGTYDFNQTYTPQQYTPGYYSFDSKYSPTQIDYDRRYNAPEYTNNRNFEADEYNAPDIESIGDAPAFKSPGAMDYAKYTPPVYDEQKIKAMTQEQAAPAIRGLRNAVQRVSSRYYDNPNVAKMTLREALEGYGQGLQSAMSQAANTARSLYNTQYGYQADAAKTNALMANDAAKMNYQGLLEAAKANFNAEMAKYGYKWESISDEAKQNYLSKMQAKLTNFQTDVDADRLNFQAALDEGRINYQTGFDIAKTNAGFANDAAKTNFLTLADAYNRQYDARNQANQFNANASNQANQFNISTAADVAKTNYTTQANAKMAEYNAVNNANANVYNAQNQAGMYNASAQNERSQTIYQGELQRYMKEYEIAAKAAMEGVDVKAPGVVGGGATIPSNSGGQTWYDKDTGQSGYLSYDGKRL